MKKFLAAILFIFLIFGTIIPVKAQEQQIVEDVNSFELFWPMVAGKVPGDSVYPLKRSKEVVRGLLIFSPIKKADYMAFVATKRVLEGEKLKSEGKVDLAKKSFVQAAKNIDSSSSNLDKSKSGDEQGSPARATLASKLNKLETFLKWYRTQEPDLSGEIQNLLDKVVSESGKI